MHAPRLIIYSAAAAAVALIGVAGCGAASPGTTTTHTGTLTNARFAQGLGLGTGSNDQTVSATGHGQVEGTPDLLTITVGVQSSGARLQPTLATNNQEAQAVISKLEGDGVLAKDIQTSQLSVNPNYSQPTPNAAPKLVGYQVTDIVTANIHQLDRGGAIIDDAVAAGGNDSQVQSIVYSVENTGPLAAAARAAAVKQAEGEAQSMATAAGVHLGAVVAVNDLAQPQYQCCVANGLSASIGAPSGGGVSPAPLQPGQQIVTADVSVVYAIS
jgi:uncharacterized protein YggE